ncbi:hypothetical protein GCM10029978_078600 [Actinoallomurus acanthiterrae]
MADSYFSDAGLAVVAALREIATARGAEPATIALAWLRQRPNVVAPIASARTVGQLPALVASVEVELGEDELKALDEVSARVPA